MQFYFDENENFPFSGRSLYRYNHLLMLFPYYLPFWVIVLKCVLPENIYFSIYKIKV